MLILAAAIPYLPFASLPPLQDDYGHVELARQYGPPSGWCALLHDPLYRCRSTSLVATWMTLRLFGLSYLAFHLSAILLHAVNACLLYSLGVSRFIGWRVSAAAGFFFAVRERHHEAVIWYASLHELFVFAFVLLAILAWIRWLEGGSRWWWLATAMLWCLALASKESAVILTGLLPAFSLLYGRRGPAVFVPFVLGVISTAAYFLAAQAQSSQHQHFSDGTFVFGFHFLTVLANSAARGMWIWGALSLLVLWWNRATVPWRTAILAACWFLMSMLPYAFLSYMPRIPSRHHYLASAGAAILLALALNVLLPRLKRPAWTATLILSAFFAHNCTYLWYSKLPQFEARAELLEGLLRMVRQNPGRPVYVRCQEVLINEARLAVRERLRLEDGQIRLTNQPAPDAVEYDCPAPPPAH